jgi:shikimate kinase
MILALLGMSGVGKTSWARKFALAGFTCLHCDDLIAAKLRANGDIVDSSVEAVGRWMGFPFDAGYSRREAQYLAYEADVLAMIADCLPQAHMENRQMVIDMTGSAIYIEPTLLDAIHRFAIFIYLEATPAHYNQLLEAYRTSPRPIIWKAMYQPLPGEEPAATLARCYPQLIRVRADLYAKLSDVVLEPRIHQDQTATVDDFLRAVERARAEG